MRAKLASFGLAALCVVVAPTTASAFCGFYVSGADAELYNNATRVVLMRHKTRTVLSMENNYEGPAKDFAMVVPVPVVLQKENVKTLPASVFDKVDKMAAPRLVEYWEQDPCRQMVYAKESKAMARPSGARARTGSASKDDDLGVTVEAKFKVAEYQILILSAKDSGGLDKWLRREKYNIPKGAEPVLRPYVSAGMKFFVAKVDYKKVRKVNGRPTLRPLRFHYDSKEFSLPIRLGMLNSKGTQDLIVHILAPGKRYEVANYKNAFIPTNLDVSNAARKQFGTFYASLFDATLKKNPGAVITEYSWDASTCDPCPGPRLGPSEMTYLGLDVLYKPAKTATPTPAKPVMKPPTGAPRAPVMRRRFRRPMWRGLVLTRLHARYTKNDIKQDLIFKEAKAVQGGREWWRMQNGKRSLMTGAAPSGRNMFQARYAIRHKWTGRVDCKNPRYGIWGGPPRGQHRPATKPALDLAFAKRNATLTNFVKSDVPELGIKAPAAAKTTGGTGTPVQTKTVKPKKKSKKKKGCSVAESDAGTAGVIALVGIALLVARRRRAGHAAGGHAAGHATS